MMICSNCGRVFREDESDFCRELVGEYCGQPAYQDYRVCPECHSDEIGEAVRCPICDEYYDGYEDYCDNCLQYIATSLTGYIGSLQLALGTDYKTTKELIEYELGRR